MTIDLYPPIEPFDTGLLQVSDGDAVAWEVSGAPHGNPAVVVYGGPGQGSARIIEEQQHPSPCCLHRWFELHAACQPRRLSKSRVERDLAYDAYLVRRHAALEEVGHLLNVLQVHEREGVPCAIAREQANLF